MTRAAHEPAPSAERRAQVAELLDRATRWAAARADVTGLLLAGSWARGAARPDSDVDLVLLTTAPEAYADGAWAAGLGLGARIRTGQWGPVTEYRHLAEGGLEVEIGVAHPDWARTGPVDPGTRRVVTDGSRPLYDPSGLLAALLRACES
ncbi:MULTISPECIES: nucleotidyltransferase domain-containing protein [Streptomyces]|uniref:Polymerase nucleotidyl transferase domain-containing protein n=2 Tax=Streptomyces TaxID=1883 RepID=A0A2U9NW92_STRAS|nr:nucleotidyltransferase domain-containing protein [Streptomyces actuosus]AWT41553.1 hypothetical protein DMT42_04000 [Streptomyces actuosus]MBM4825874.1 nucleotidyltransferase domain-containing protein [Streptomyces actuosus]